MVLRCDRLLGLLTLGGRWKMLLASVVISDITSSFLLCASSAAVLFLFPFFPLLPLVSPSSVAAATFIFLVFPLVLSSFLPCAAALGSDRASHDGGDTAYDYVGDGVQEAEADAGVKESRDERRRLIHRESVERNLVVAWMCPSSSDSTTLRSFAANEGVESALLGDLSLPPLNIGVRGGGGIRFRSV
jgi:hypothetical protein